MDFTLIKNHPWITAGSVLVGGFLLYLLFRRPSSSGGSTGVVYAGGQSDPAATAANTQLALGQLGANVQMAQIGAGLQALQIQSDTALKAKTLDVATSLAGINAQQDITNRQTDATLQLGLGAQSSNVEALRIQAGAQRDLIDAIVGAYGGTPTPRTSVSPYGGSPGTMNGTNYPQVQGTVNQVPTVPLTSIGTAPTGGFTQGQVIPGGTQLVPYPTYQSTPGNPYGGCSPLDASCVEANEALSNQWHLQTAQAQIDNNTNQCLSNADYGGRTPDEIAALKAACYANRTTQYSSL